MTTRRAPFTVAVIVLACGAGWAAYQLQNSGGMMTEAAVEFLGSLTPEQRQQATMEFQSPARVDWHFIPKPSRKGLQIRDMNAEQRKRAHALLASALSEIGYHKATEIMSLEEILRELEQNRAGGPLRDPERYYFTLFGQPDADGNWALSIEGHHLSLNFVVEKGRVVSHTPAFFGANPAEVKTELAVGPKKGTRTLAKEEQLAFDLVGSLSGDQRQRAVIAEKAPHDLRAAGEPQPPDSAPEGLIARDMSDSQRKTLRALIESYLENMPADVAAMRRAELDDDGLETVHFAWAGAPRPGIGHYYRLQGRRFLVEFVNTQPDSAGNPANHIHSVWRDLRGDFGLSR